MKSPKKYKCWLYSELPDETRALLWPLYQDNPISCMSKDELFNCWDVNVSDWIDAVDNPPDYIIFDIDRQ